MIANVAPKSPEAVGSAAPASSESAGAGDTGVFDALLAQQAIAAEDTVTEVTAGMAGAFEGMELPGALEDSDDTDDAVALPDALWFLAAMSPTTQKPVTPVAAGTSASIPIQNAAVPESAAAGVAAPATGGTGTAAEFAQAFVSHIVDADAQAASTPAIDTTSWNSMTGPAEMFAQGARHAAERVEAATLTTHVRDPRWADDLGNRLASMVRTGESSASLQLTPVDLGPLEVNVSVRDNQATVHFGAANAETRALLEASIPRLREMLASQGFSLMDSSVSHGFARQTRHEAAGTPRVDALGESPAVTAQPIHISGLLDLYA